VFAQRQVNRRNPAAAAANPQMQTITKVMPFLFGIWGWAFQAGLTLYWTTSSALRIVQQWALYRFDPTLSESVKEKKADLAREATSGSKKGQKEDPKSKKPTKSQAGGAKADRGSSKVPAKQLAGEAGSANSTNGSGSGASRPNPGRQQPKKRRKGR